MFVVRTLLFYTTSMNKKKNSNKNKKKKQYIVFSWIREKKIIKEEKLEIEPKTFGVQTPIRTAGQHLQNY